MTPEEKRQADEIVNKAVQDAQDAAFREAVNSMPVNKSDAKNEILERMATENKATSDVIDAIQLGIITDKNDGLNYIDSKVREKTIEQYKQRRRIDAGVKSNGHGGYEDANGNQCDEDGYRI